MIWKTICGFETEWFERPFVDFVLSCVYIYNCLSSRGALFYVQLITTKTLVRAVNTKVILMGHWRTLHKSWLKRTENRSFTLPRPGLEPTLAAFTGSPWSIPGQCIKLLSQYGPCSCSSVPLPVAWQLTLSLPCLPRRHSEYDQWKSQNWNH